MTTLTKERIAEFVDKGRARWDEREELGRLALLGLRVEKAPVGILQVERGDLSVGIGDLWYVYDADITPDTHAGKRVRLVVEDQE